MKEIFTMEMKVSDLVDINYSLLLVLPRLGVDLKHANMPVADACRKCGIDAHTFLLVCNVYTFADYVPSVSDIACGNINDIIHYLHNSHLYYTGGALRSLEKGFDLLTAPCDEHQKKVILKFFLDYREELGKHFAYEEDNVFTYVRSLMDESSPYSGDYSITQFEEHHENVEEKLEDMKNIVMKYLPSECDNTVKTGVLFSIYQLQDDLRHHTYVENNVLVPIVTRLEKHGK